MCLKDRCALISLINEGAPISATRELTRLEIKWKEITDILMRLMQGAIKEAPPPQHIHGPSDRYALECACELRYLVTD